MDFSKIVDWLKLKPTHFLTIAIATGALLLFGDRVARLLGLAQLRSSYLPWIGGAFLISTAYLLAHGTVSVGAYLQSKVKARQQRRRHLAIIRRLSPVEKAIVREMAFGDSRTRKFPIDDGVVGGLEAQKVVYQSSSVGHIFNGLAYNLQPWVAQFVRDDPSLLE